MSSPMNIDFPDERVLSAVRPYLQRMLPADAPEGRALIRARRKSVVHAAAKEIAARALQRRNRRGSADVERHYANSYAVGVASLEDAFAPDRYINTYRLNGDRLLVMPLAGLMTAYLAALEAALAALRPNSVAEIGFGSGKNLLYLAPRFPDTTFSGFELTHSGVELARGLQGLDSLPPNLGRWIGRDGPEAAASFRRIDFRQGNAAALPAPDKSVDLAFSVLALEQMADILPGALAEIRRITRRHVVFLEPFREANDAFGRLHLWSWNYFRAGRSDLAAAGFRPLAMIRNLPNKLTFGAAMMVAEVA